MNFLVRRSPLASLPERAWLRLAVVLTMSLSAACTQGEEPVPIDFDSSSTPGDDGAPSTEGSTVGSAPEVVDDVNAEANQMVVDAAEQQCLDDPDKVEGVVRIVAPDTGDVVSEYRVDCSEVRAGQ